MTRGEHDARTLMLACGEANNLGAARNTKLTWKKFCVMLSEVEESRETFRKYKSLTQDQQHTLKRKAGWYLGASVKGKRRRDENVQDREIVTLDLDDIEVDEYDRLMSGDPEQHYLNRFEYHAHTTRSHTAVKPRLRVVLLASEPIGKEMYDPLCRIMSHNIDEEMAVVDKTCWRASQLMYWPTKSKDQDFNHWHNKGELVNALDILESWPTDWRDRRSLPKHATETEEDMERFTGKKPQDPTEKSGPVGVFCRAYTIEDVINEFLADTYGDQDETSKDVRYSYLPGGSQYGAIVYDNKWMWSWHGTDPAGDARYLRNAWDLVRIHKFGTLDEDKDQTDDEQSISQLPSSKAMLEWAKKQRGYHEQQVLEHAPDDSEFEDLTGVGSDEDDDDEIDIDDLLGPPSDSIEDYLPDYPGKHPPLPIKKKWTAGLEVVPGGKFKNTSNNILRILNSDKRLRGVVGYNALAHRIVQMRDFDPGIPGIRPMRVKDPVNGDMWSDRHDSIVRAFFSQPDGQMGGNGWGFDPGKDILSGMMAAVAYEHAFHPVIKMLENLPPWDGVDRVSRLWIDYMGCEDTPYHRETATLLMKAAICRAYTPGVTFEYVPMLISDEEHRKSSFVKVMGYDHWFREFHANMDDAQKSVEGMVGAWWLEMPELTSFKKADAQMQKNFFSRTGEVVRMAYDRHPKEFTRSCVFVGTTNEHEFLSSPQNRRFWPIMLKVDMIDTERLEANRDQIYAQAKYLWEEDIKALGKGNAHRMRFNLSPEAKAEAKQLQASARVHTTADAFQALTKDYITPQLLIDILADEDGCAPLDIGEDVWAVRTKVVVEELIVRALGEDMPKAKAQRDSLGREVTNIMHRMPGWARMEVVGRSLGRKNAHSNRSASWPHKGRGFAMEGITYQEWRDGYRIVPRPKTDDDDNDDDDDEVEDLL